MTRRRRSLPSPFVVVFWVVLGTWMLYPFTTIGAPAQDALHEPAAGRLWRTDPAAVYQQTTPRIPGDALVRVYCDMSDGDRDCAMNATLFTSAPLLLPVVALLEPLGGLGSTLLIRLGGAACYVAGMVMLIRRLGPTVPRLVPVFMVVCLTPLVVNGLGLGQSSPLLFLGACLGLRRTDQTRRAVLVGVLWLVSAAMKLSPLPLVALLIVRRRWKVLAAAAATAAVLTAIVLVRGPPSIFGDYVRFLRFNGGDLDLDTNGAPRLVLATLVPATATNAAFKAGFLVALLGISGWIFWRYRRCALDVQWSIAYLLLIVLSPIVWLHYCWLVLAAFGAIAAARDRPTSADLALLVGSAATLGLLGATNFDRSASYGSYLSAALIVVLVALAVLPVPKAVMAPVTFGRRDRSRAPERAGPGEAATRSGS